MSLRTLTSRSDPHWLWRERLVRAVLGSAQPICVLQAPPGYGKSVLLQQIASELAQGNQPCQWAFSGAAESARAYIEPKAPPCLLIDSPSRFDDEEADRALALLETLPPSGRAVVATRQPRVARAIASYHPGSVSCFTARDLRFSYAEFSQMLRPSAFTPEILSQTYEWTNGWPLAAALIESDRLQHESQAASELDLEEPAEQVHTYFAARVLAQIDEPLRSFLLVCGDFAELDPRILQECGAADNAAALLEQLHERGVFIERLERRAQVYGLQPHFRSFLEDLRAAHGQSPPATFHTSIASRFEATGSCFAALHHAYRSGDRPFLALLLDRLGPFRIILSQAYLATKYFRALPESMVRAHPMLALARIYLLHIGGTPYFARDRLTKFLRSEAVRTDRKVALYARLIEFISRIHEDRVADIAEIEACEQSHADVLAEDTVAQTVFYRLAALAHYEADHIRESMVLSERVLQLSLEQDLPFIAGFSSLQHAMARLKLGDLAGADELLTRSSERTLECFGPANHLPALIGVVLARIRVERLNLESAARLIDTHLGQIELRPAWLINSAEAAFSAAAFVCYEANGAEATVEYLYRKREIFRIGGLHNGDVTLAMLQVRALLRAGRIDEARAHLQDEPLASVLAKSPAAHTGPLSLLANVLLCHELVRSQEPQSAAESRLDELERMVQKCQDVILGISWRIARTLHQLRAGDLRSANTTLFQVIRLSARFDVARPLYENWRLLAPALGEKGPPFLSQRELSFLQKIRELAARAQDSNLVNTEGTTLSSRERQILLLLADGYSSKEMARTLNIAVGTVKGYRRTLYEKLHIFTRSEAVSAARRLGLTTLRPAGANTEGPVVSRDGGRR
ncbi:MAG TPA: LuxR C-terminal-related transcriptional regulator [Steroidobacteraceae bacterium]|nr:LuxR C-terminal-related transcriptional regulator [Steroidobacteraceae bacterium]